MTASIPRAPLRSPSVAHRHLRRQSVLPLGELCWTCAPSGHAVLVFPTSSISMLDILVGFASVRVSSPRSMPGGASARILRYLPVASPARKNTTDSAKRISSEVLLGCFACGIESGRLCRGPEQGGWEDFQNGAQRGVSCGVLRLKYTRCLCLGVFRLVRISVHGSGPEIYTALSRIVTEE